MRIPRNMEWRAGVSLLGSAIILLGLLIVLILARMDVGLELEGSLDRTQIGWVLSVEIPGERLSLVHRCKHVRIRNGEGQVWYGRISDISGRLEQEKVSVQITIVEEESLYTAILDSTQTVQAMLIDKQDMPILRVLIESTFNVQKSQG